MKKAFTLVELIVTITILAILATIGFVSYGYIIENSRNSKVVSQLSQLQKSLAVGITSGIDIFAFVIPQTENIIIDPYIAGDITPSNQYIAGGVNYLALDYKNKEQENNYKIGVTKKILGKYQIAGSITDDSLGTTIAKISGNYSPRKAIETKSEVNSISPKYINLVKNNGLKAGDSIKTIGTTVITTTITKIKSGDTYNNIIYTNTVIPSGTTHIILADDETKGLIMGKDINSNTGIVEESGIYIP